MLDARTKTSNKDGEINRVDAIRSSARLTELPEVKMPNDPNDDQIKIREKTADQSPKPAEKSRKVQQPPSNKRNHLRAAKLRENLKRRKQQARNLGLAPLSDKKSTFKIDGED